MEKDGVSMSIISEVKCARCDRNYSGLRSRCPYCGARRIGSGKYSEEGSNTKGKMIIGVLIMAVLVVAAGVLLFTTPKPAETEDPSPEVTSSSIFEPPGDTDELVMPGDGPSFEPSDEPPATSEETETPSTAPPKIESITITYAGVKNTDFMEKIGTQIQLQAKVEPVGAALDEPIKWTSSDESIFSVVPKNLDGTTAMVTIVGGDFQDFGILTVSVAGLEAKCYVRVGEG